MNKCLYKLTDVKLPHCRAKYKSDCGFLYVRTNGPDNKPIEGEQCMKCHKPITLIEVDKIQEELAEYAHKQWSGWMEYLFNKCEYLLNGKMVIPKWAVERWQKQIKTYYKDLSQEEKASDRSEAEGMLNIFKAADLLPIEKDCPGCEGSGTVKIYPEYVQVGEFTDICPICKSKETIQIYYTPEQYEKIMDKPFPLGGMVWYYVSEWRAKPYNQVKAYFPNTPQAIVQTGQPAPPADYRPEK